MRVQAYQKARRVQAAMAILITGGARSGKSRFAEQYAQRSGARGIYIATCQAYDVEMVARIGLHQKDRLTSGFAWETLEEPYAVADLLNHLAEQLHNELAVGSKGTGSEDEVQAATPVVLLDCLTLWLSNWLLRAEQEQMNEEQQVGVADRLLQEAIDKLLEAIECFPYPLIIVTNEVGDGIVPAYPLGRQFRDAAGKLNQRVAAVCDRVFLVTVGIPLELKSTAFNWDQL